MSLREICALHPQEVLLLYSGTVSTGQLFTQLESPKNLTLRYTDRVNDYLRTKHFWVRRASEV